VASAALRLLLRHAFEDLGLVRVEAYVDAGDPHALRIAAGAGLRHEGLLRQRETAGERRSDHAVLARLVDDPDPGTGEGLRATHNSLLPRKRAIAHGVIRDSRGRVLLTEQTIKPQWDLPGGVVEPDESPWQGVVREVREELGLELSVAGLLAVNWLPSWRQWDDACIFVFDLGVHDAAIVERMTLQATEIRAVHWSDADLVQERAAAATADLLAEVLSGDLSAPRYLEAGRPPAT